MDCKQFTWISSFHNVKVYIRIKALVWGISLSASFRVNTTRGHSFESRRPLCKKVAWNDCNFRALEKQNKHYLSEESLHIWFMRNKFIRSWTTDVFSSKSHNFGLKINWGAFWVFSVDLSAPILVLWVSYWYVRNIQDIQSTKKLWFICINKTTYLCQHTERTVNDVVFATCCDQVLIFENLQAGWARIRGATI